MNSSFQNNATTPLVQAWLDEMSAAGAKKEVSTDTMTYSFRLKNGYLLPFSMERAHADAGYRAELLAFANE